MLAEIAIIATALAEVLGTAIGIQLLFRLPLKIGIAITAPEVLVILALQRMGFRYLEVFVITMLAVIAMCFGVQIFLASPDWAAATRGLIPDATLWRDRVLLFLALGIVGATVMSHNLYLISAAVPTRVYGNSRAEKKEVPRYTTLAPTTSLALAFPINASLLILAAAAFHRGGHTNVAEFPDAHAPLAPLMGSNLATTLFGIALLCCG